MASRSWKAPSSKVRRQCSGCAPFFSLLMNGPSRWAPAQAGTQSHHPSSPHQGPRNLLWLSPPPLLLPCSCCKTHGSGNSGLSTAKDTVLAAGPSQATAVTLWEWSWSSVCRMAETMAKGRHRLREEAGLCYLCISPMERAPAPISAVPTIASFSLMKKESAYLEQHQRRQQGTSPLTQDTCSMSSTVSYADLRKNLETGVHQTWHPRHRTPVCHNKPRPQVQRKLCGWTT